MAPIPPKRLSCCIQHDREALNTTLRMFFKAGSSGTCVHTARAQGRMRAPELWTSSVAPSGLVPEKALAAQRLPAGQTVVAQTTRNVLMSLWSGYSPNAEIYGHFESPGWGNYQ